MNCKSNICLSLLAVFLISLQLNSQPSFLNGLNQFPSTPAELESSNGILARAYAPVLHQFVNGSSVYSENGAVDTPVRVNYDGDWTHSNNWENASQIYNDALSPAAYYHVQWTENYWIIVYSYYYARDFGNGMCFPEDNHEGDLVRVLLTVGRSSYVVQGFATQHHGSNDIVECVDYADYQNSICPILTSPGYYPGMHIIVYSATGSHAMFDDHTSGFDDPPFNPCKPLVSTEVAYYPGDPPLYYSDELEQPEYCDNFSPYYGKYRLISIFDPLEGLWDKRPIGASPGDVFVNAPLAEQKFTCVGNGDCDKAASAPWNGPFGINPARWIEDNMGSFNCDCEGADARCEAGNFHECIYQYNQYMCDVYQIELPSNFDYQGAWVDNPHQDNTTLVVSFSLSADGGYEGSPTSINWTYEVPNGVTANCLGCNSSSNRVTLFLQNTTIDDIISNPNGYQLSVTANFVECGTITRSFDFETVNGLIGEDTDCTKMIIDVSDDYHLPGNQYSWDFPLYDALATISNNGRRVEFNTETVIQNTTVATNPDKLLEYELTVSNTAYTDDLVFNGDMKIPDCQYGNLSMIVYPNPTTDNIYLSFDGKGSTKSIFDVYILDHQFNQIAKHNYSLGNQRIDVSTLENGIYYLYTVTDSGDVLCEKICISNRH
ncbi:MAG: T9SS type A sorting domain-containing protein [Bacteroidota bacterium]